MEKKKRCPKCQVEFSEHLIIPIHINNESLPLCPLCALELINTMCDLPLDTPFRGEIAKKLYIEALKEASN